MIHDPYHISIARRIALTPGGLGVTRTRRHRATILPCAAWVSPGCAIAAASAARGGGGTHAQPAGSWPRAVQWNSGLSLGLSRSAGAGWLGARPPWLGLRLPARARPAGLPVARPRAPPAPARRRTAGARPRDPGGDAANLKRPRPQAGRCDLGTLHCQRASHGPPVGAAPAGGSKRPSRPGRARTQPEGGWDRDARFWQLRARCDGHH
jgi:hypothetical protein